MVLLPDPILDKAYQPKEAYLGHSYEFSLPHFIFNNSLRNRLQHEDPLRMGFRRNAHKYSLVNRHMHLLPDTNPKSDLIHGRLHCCQLCEVLLDS
jgi:hypothetical protein